MEYFSCLLLTISFQIRYSYATHGCPAPPPADLPPHVVITNASDEIGGEIWYGCESGYATNDSAIDVAGNCQDSHLWDISPPDCYKLCTPLPDLAPYGYYDDPECTHKPVASETPTECTGTCNHGSNPNDYVADGWICTNETEEWTNSSWSSIPNADASRGLCIPESCSALSIENAYESHISLPLMQGGYYEYSTVVTWKCNDTHEDLIGAKNRTCVAQDTWNETDIVCTLKHCVEPSVANIEDFRSTVAVTTDPDTGSPGYPVGTGLVFTCLPGFDFLPGQTGLTVCSNSKTWDNLPQCMPITCALAAPPPGTDILANGDIFGDSMAFQCQVGYNFTGIGDLERTCDASLLFNGTAPICSEISCGDPPTLPNTTVNVADTYYGSNATYECDVNFHVLSGDPVKYCLGDPLEWQGEDLVCVEVECPDPPTIQNATYQVNGYDFDASATYKCDEGLLSTGFPKITCLITSEWSASSFSCYPPTCYFPDEHEYAYPVFSPDQGNASTFVKDTVATYECVHGAESIGGHMETGCNSIGGWSDTLTFICKPYQCGDAPLINSSIVTYDSTYIWGFATYECMHGYKYVSGGVHKNCTMARVWEGEDIYCERITCPAPEIRASVEQISTHKDEYFFRDITRFTCALGYKVEPQWSNTLRICGEDGNWDGGQLVCTIKQCDIPTVSWTKNETLRVRYSSQDYLSIATYYCARGYYLYGGDTDHHCSLDGTWSGLEPSCAIVQCGNPPVVKNSKVHVNDTVFESLAHYVCNDKTTLLGDSYVKCLPDGQWSEPPMCLGDRCPLPDVNEHSFYHLETPRVGDTVEYLCSEGYTLVGQSTRTCGGQNLTWDGVAPICNRAVCQMPKDVPNAKWSRVINGENLRYGSIVDYACFPQYKKISGNNKRSCNSSGDWSGEPLVCKEKHGAWLYTLPPVNYTSIEKNLMKFGITPADIDILAILVGFIVTVSCFAAVFSVLYHMELEVFQKHKRFFDKNVEKFSFRWPWTKKRKGRRSDKYVVSKP